jgi:uncharacterized repeat protein (TIGR01451 family)
MNRTFLKVGFGWLAVAGTVLAASAAAPGAMKQLHGHVPPAVSQLSPTGQLDATNRLHLAIGLPLHNQAALNTLLQQMYDPASTNYQRYLAPADFAAQFGPTEQDYQAVVAFAQSHGLTVAATHANRMLIEVNAKAADVENAFNVTLHTYRHPTENRTFYSPDTEPTVPAALPVADISGLNNYARPHPKLRLQATNAPSSFQPRAGSGPGGNYMGYDFRAAYVPGTTLTGAGQQIALVQFDGYFASDIALYAQQAGLPTVALTNILLNGFNGSPTFNGGEVEVSLDIEMVISMAPGLSQVMVYEGDPYNFLPNVVLNQIAVDNAARQVSCSWGWTGGPNTTSEQIFQQMAVQGQSFYNASGDSDAFLPGEVDSPFGFGFPSCSPNITQVGGTTLTTVGPVGAYVSEQVWNWGQTYGIIYDGVGSCGGISDHYPTPSWQVGFGTSTNHGSATGRNIPDVALTADNVYVIADGGIEYPGTGGTSCAAPLWAGYTALINQQAALNGRSSVGFINPAIYALAKTAAYNNCFNDTTNGNNTWSQSLTNFFAVPGYDLCTGLGTPNGTNLINALTGGAASTGPVISAPKTWADNLSVMNGTDPNGPWFLFVQDTRTPYSGIISNGWFVTLTTADPVGFAADNQIYATPTNLALTVGAHWNFTLAVTNYGPSISTNVYVTDNLPDGLILVSNTPALGSVSQIGSTLTWSLGTLATNTGATLSLSFLASSPGTYTNSATVASDGTSDPNPDDDTIVATAVFQSATPPHLSPVSYTSGGGFLFHVTGDAVLTTIQGSTNLVNWVDLFSGIPPFDFTDSQATNYPSRFYRAVGP